jgi:Xaa-Pro aminopeptidase
MSVFVARRDRLWQAAAQEGLAAVLITNPLNVTYLTGFSGDSTYLILSPAKALLVSDGRYTQQIAEECPGLDTYIRGTAQTLPEATIAQLNLFGASNIGCESGHLSIADFDGLKDGVKTAQWKPVRDRVEKLRQVKDATEIAQIREAIHIAQKAFAMFRAMLRPEENEKDLTDALEGYVRRAGGTGSAFPPIVAVGPRAALPHAPPSLQKVSGDPLLLVDWGAQGRFYKSDLTRVLWTRNKAPFPGEHGPSDQLRAIHAVVKEAQRRAIAAMRPGVSSKVVDHAARGWIADQGYGEFFNHGLGHGFGLQIHESPFIRPNVEVFLEAGMVVTCEPGIYLPDWGGVRIEDDILITPDGPEVLTDCPRELEESVVEF